jgi:hypothetical protein
LKRFETFIDAPYITNVLKLKFYLFVFLQLIQEEMRGKSAKVPESSSKDEEEGTTEKEDDESSGSDEDGSSGSGSDDNGSARVESDHNDSSPKVDIII